MGGYIPVRSLGAFSYDCSDRGVLVLKAYLDDSGTHGPSKIIAMGGIIAAEEAWTLLEPQWRDFRDELQIKKMHMSHCEGFRGDFSVERGWGPTKRDYAIGGFRKLVEETGGRMVASAVSRSAWNSVASVSRLAEVFADPIDFLCHTAVKRALEAKRGSTVGHEEVDITFDCREQSIIAWNKLAEGYEGRWPERLVKWGFGRMEKVLPLQAADMIAYEAYVFRRDWEEQGGEPEARPNFRHLLENLDNDFGFYTEENLLEYIKALETATEG